ncbi:MAG: hypothetical protein L3K15_04705 [Thermoplasmata archaeon]|nr:hypothetical protein [Thermoplasmata archaeon]
MPRLRLAALSSAGASVGLAVLMLLAPAAAGSPALTAVKLAPPFHATVTTSQFVASSGCAAAKEPDPPQFSNANGVGLAREWTRASTGCSPGSGYGYVYNSLTIAWAIPIAASGPHSIKINAAYSFNASAAISFAGPCPTTTTTSSYGTFTSGYCTASASVGFQGPFYLFDTTNFSSLASPHNLPPFALTAENSVSTYYGCYSPSYGGTCFSYNSTTYSLHHSYAVPTTGPIPVVFWINGTLDSSHTYVLYWYGSTFTTAYASGWPTATAKSHLDFQTGGNGVFFHSITIH